MFPPFHLSAILETPFYVYLLCILAARRRVFVGYFLSLLCEGLDQVIHRSTMIRQRLYRSEEIVVRSVATDLFGETTSICTSSYAVSNKSGAAPNRWLYIHLKTPAPQIHSIADALFLVMMVCIRHGMREKVMFLISCDAFLGTSALHAQHLSRQTTAEKLWYQAQSETTCLIC